MAACLLTSSAAGAGADVVVAADPAVGFRTFVAHVVAGGEEKTGVVMPASQKQAVATVKPSTSVA